MFDAIIDGFLKIAPVLSFPQSDVFDGPISAHVLLSLALGSVCCGVVTEVVVNSLIHSVFACIAYLVHLCLELRAIEYLDPIKRFSPNVEISTSTLFLITELTWSRDV